LRNVTINNESNHLKWTNNQISKEKYHLNKESGDLARHTSAAKYFDRKADHLDKVIADG
jgi:hypothetical protein